MKRMIRVCVEIYSPNDSTDYYDLPDGWDDLTAEERAVELVDWAKEALFQAAGAAASVVEVDEDDKEIRVLDEGGES